MNIVKNQWFPGILIVVAFIAFLLSTSFIKGSLDAPAGKSPGGMLSVEVTGLRNKKGKVIVCLYNALPFSDRGNNIAYRLVGISGDDANPGVFKAAAQFSGVAIGYYALFIFHDENSNYQPDFEAEIPLEGIGISNMHQAGPPASNFNEVKFHLGKDELAITVPVFYYQ